MSSLHTSDRSADTLRTGTGIAIPVYLPEGIDAAHGEALVRDTARRCSEQVGDAGRVCLTVDGEGAGGAAARAIAADLGLSVVVAEENRGKLSSAAAGIELLLSRGELRYAVILDQDGDHFPNELLNFVRVADHVADRTGTDRLMVLGQRISRHRPMGFFRGELEELADRVLLDGLQYHAAVSGVPLRLEYALAESEFPDFHSGYKLFSARTARDVFLGEHHMAGVSETCYFRHACEAVMSVEAMVSGAYLGIVNRSTFNEQPISTFGLFERRQMVADKMIWPCKRLDVPGPFVRQWLDNHVPRLLLSTLAPYGTEELAEIRRIVLEAFGEEGSGDPLVPLFV